MVSQDEKCVWEVIYICWIFLDSVESNASDMRSHSIFSPRFAAPETKAEPV